MALAQKRFIVCLTGMPGAGKSTVASALKERGFTMITMGDAVREEARRQNMDPSDANLGKLMLKLRQELGQGAVAQLILRRLQKEDGESLKKSKNEKIVIDGVRSIPEVEVLKAIGNVRLLAIHASPKTRFTHIKERKRSDAPASGDEFENRDRREMSVGVSEAIALADEVVSNDSITIEQLKGKALTTVQKWLDEISRSDDDRGLDR